MDASDAVTQSAPRPVGRLEILLAALLAAISLSTVFVVPLVGVLGLPMAAVPVLRLAHRRGILTGLLACAVAMAIVFGLGWAAGSVGEAVGMALLAAGVTMLPTVTVGFLRAGVDPSRCYLGLCLVGCGFLAAAFLAALGGQAPSVASDVASTFDRLIPAAVDSYSRTGVDAESIARMRSTLEAMREFARRYLWGILGALWVCGAAIAFYTGARVARPAPTAEAVRFEALRIPPVAAGIFVAAGAAFGLLRGEWRRAAGNLLLPLLALFFVAGLSIICHFFRRWFRVRVLRAGLYALAAYFPINVGVVLLGLFDWYIDFRRRGEGAIEKS